MYRTFYWQVRRTFVPQVNDEYKLIVLLPKLKMYNDKDISSRADHVRHTSSSILYNRVRRRQPRLMHYAKVVFS